MNLRPFFSFFGGKYRAAPHYPTPEHDTIVEPFAGSAGYSVRHAERRIILIEKDPIIAGLWRYLIRVRASEVRRIPLLAHDQTVDDLHVCEEARALVGFWLNKANVSPCRSPSAWMRGGTCPDSYWGAAIRERIASQVDHIRHWRCIHASYSEAEILVRSATWFVDPPYERAGVHYRCSSRQIDFAHLASWCLGLPGQVMVCEAEGADWLPFAPFRAIRSNPSKRGKGISREVLWIQSSALARSAA